MKRSLPLAAAALVAVLLIWSLRPLKSEEWDIEFDPELQTGKDNYLKDLAGSPVTKNQPNVVLILADDLGLTDISLYGSEHLETPNIDSIGKDGISYTQAYASAPICSPSRAGLLTGRYQNRFGFDSQPMTIYARNKLEYFGFKYFVDTDPMFVIDNESIPTPDQIERQGMPPNEILLSEALSAAGYHCDIVGKWHLGYGELQHPNNRGFQTYYGFLEAFSYFIDPDLPTVESWQFDEFSEKHIWKQERDGYSAIQRNGAIIEEDVHLTDAFAREATARIKDSASTGEPFFLYVPFSAPHTPFQALTEYTSRFAHIEDPKKRIYYAMISQLDDAVGRILAGLESAGVTENTIVIFSSDNGGASYTGATGNDPLRGGKMSHFEGGLSVPLMIKWPGRIPAGLEENHPVIHLDLFTTILDSVSVPLPDDRVMDGINILKPESSETLSSRPLFWRSDYNHIIQRGNWKLLMNEKDGSLRLYNLADDREENFNLAEQRPDIVDELRNIFLDWNSRMAPPSWPRVMDYFFNEDGEEYWFAT